ncbi:uncharacterized protein LOC142345735 isoform X3 [Convolutriloba macropyga]|uniref:uncharacterized protein LOC142345735 isoform X3 n=1 Tax=Convolutriloba macropyga TaxID=536237 RepID=UPI003F51C076
MKISNLFRGCGGGGLLVLIITFCLCFFAAVELKNVNPSVAAAAQNQLKQQGQGVPHGQPQKRQPNSNPSGQSVPGGQQRSKAKAGHQAQKQSRRQAPLDQAAGAGDPGSAPKMKQKKQQPPLQQTVERATGNAGAGGSQPQQQMTKEQMRELHKKKAAAAAASGGNAGNDNAGAPPVKDVKVDLETQVKEEKPGVGGPSDAKAADVAVENPDTDNDDDDDDDDDGVPDVLKNANKTGSSEATLDDGVYALLRFNRTSTECKKGCSPSGVPYRMIRTRPQLSAIKSRQSSNGNGMGGDGHSGGRQRPYHSPSGVSYESIRNRPKVDFKKTRESKDGSGGGGGRGQKQKPYHTVSGIPYADVRQRVPLPDWYYTKLSKSGEKKSEGVAFASTEQAAGLRPVDESLYTDPVLLGQPGDFFDGGRIRSRDYLRKTLHLNSNKQRLPKSLINTVTLRLKEIYHKSIRPLETLFKFEEMGLGSISEAVISAKPMVLFLGPWSTGKSTMINWFVGLPKASQLYTGSQPTTTDFTVVMAGDHPRTVEGIVLAADSKQPFAGLEQFGTQFLEKFQGLEYPSQLLERLTLVDTPGIIENNRQKSKDSRGYPFNDVTQWFIDRSHLIVLVFDPTKLDVGSELESLFARLKGKESQLRLFLNKADSIPMQELMRVYGTLFWNLAPLMNTTEPPRVYTGSCWWKELQAKGINAELFLSEEQNLLSDMNDIIENQLHNKIAMLRQHAIRVRTHALLVDRFLYMWNKNKQNEKFNVQDLVEKPEKFHIFKYVQHHANVSKYDLPDPSKYKEFFDEHPLTSFRSLESLCSLFAGCPIEIIESAIRVELPNLLNALDVSIKEHQSPDKSQNATLAFNETLTAANSNSSKSAE